MWAYIHLVVVITSVRVSIAAVKLAVCVLYDERTKLPRSASTVLITSEGRTVVTLILLLKTDFFHTKK